MAAFQRAEHGRTRARTQAAATVEPAGEQRRGLFVNADRAASVALAVAHPNGRGLEVDVTQLERQDF
jgi:hypothetical protein